MIEFDSVVFEAKLSGSWVDITTDVLHNPSPRWNVGKMDSSILNRVGQAESLSFWLKNGTNTSGGLAGYYSPGHANCRSGWQPGVEVRLSFTYDGDPVPFYKYHGWILPDGIRVTPGQKSERNVEVSCLGFMGLAERHQLNLMTITTDKTMEQVAALVLANMNKSPDATDYGNGESVFPSVFDTTTPQTTASAEFNKIAISEPGWIYTKGDRVGGSTFVTKGRYGFANVANTVLPVPTASCDSLQFQDDDYLQFQDNSYLTLNDITAATFADAMLEGAEVSWGGQIGNKVRSSSYPRRVDAAATTVLWELEQATEIKAGETKTIRGRYRDPAGGASYVNGMDMVTPVASPAADYDYFADGAADGSGADMTSDLTVAVIKGAAETEFTLTNGHATDSLYIGGDAGRFRIRGRGIYHYDTVDTVFEDATSQDTYGVTEINLDMKYQDDAAVADAFGRYVLNMLKNPFGNFERIPILANKDAISMAAFLYMEPGARAAFSETQSGLTGDFFVMGYEAELIAGKYVMWYPVVIPAVQMENDLALWEFSEDFPNNALSSLVANSPINNGSNIAYAGATIDGHVGIREFKSHASTADSGARLASNLYPWIEVGTQCSCIFNVRNANTEAMIGLYSNLTFGTYRTVFNIAPSTLALTGESGAGTSFSTTATSYTLSTDTWYRAIWTVNKDAASIGFKLYSDAGALLWSDTVTANIPEGYAGAMQPRVNVVYDGSPSGVTSLLYCDFFGYRTAPSLAE